jgi:ribosomal-protein-alanine N-acetyltransferase
MSQPREKGAAGIEEHPAGGLGETSAAPRAPDDEWDPSAASTALASGSFVIEALARGSADVVFVDAIARGSFDEGDFSADKELERPWARMWVARVESADASPSAFLVAWHVADELHILNVATTPSMRRRGLGSALMRVALEYAAASRVRLVLLEVRRSNRDARRLYRRLGFTAMGVRPGYYADNGEDAIEMVLVIDPETGRIVPGRDEIRIDV